MTPAYSKEHQARRGRTLGPRSRTQVEQSREGVYMRDDYRCVAARSAWASTHPCGGGLTIGHARGRGMGGSAEFDEPAWLRTQCLVHNTLIESNARFRRFAEMEGWAIPRLHRVDPERVPVLYPDGLYYQLEHEGMRRTPLQLGDVVRMRAELTYLMEAES